MEDLVEYQWLKQIFIKKGWLEDFNLAFNYGAQVCPVFLGEKLLFSSLQL